MKLNLKRHDIEVLHFLTEEYFRTSNTIGEVFNLYDLAVAYFTKKNSISAHTEK